MSHSKIKSIVLYAFVIFLSIVVYTNYSFAQGCPVTGQTPDGGDVVVCNGIEQNGVNTSNQNDLVTINRGSDITAPVDAVVQTNAGDDKVLMIGGTVSGPLGSDCIELETGTNEFHMLSGLLLCEDHGVRADGAAGPTKIVMESGLIIANDECMNPGNSSDEIYIRGGVMFCGSAIMQTRGGEDKIYITGGVLTHTDDDDEGIETGIDNDLVSISHATVDGRITKDRRAILTSEDDDTVRIGTQATILGLTSGGEDFDTLVFEMEVPPGQIDSICSELESKDPSNDSITISGLFYEWEDFEVILCEIVPPITIPTLSQWGLITMAGILGIVGFMVVRRRQAFTNN